MNNLVQYLEQKKCFKLICGAGNSDISEITKLCAVYAKAGCKFFDVNASVKAVRAAKEGFRIAGKENECFICVSVGTKNDPHLTKFKINPDKCNYCGICKTVCLQDAIIENSTFTIEEKKCIGCKKCLYKCLQNAIESYSQNISYEKILPAIIAEGIDCIEYHAVSDNVKDILSGWNEIVELFDGVLSVSINNSKIGNEHMISIIKSMKACCDNVFMIQADGLSMSGGENDYRSTLQAVAAADIIERAHITPYIIMSGGTNTKTIELAKQCGLDISGFSAGSYARKIVKQYIDKDDFLQNEIYFREAVNAAKTLANTVLQQSRRVY